MSETTNPSSEEPKEVAKSTSDAKEPATIIFDSLLERLDNMQADLSRRNWWTNFGNVSTIIVGGLLMVFLFGYFSYGYSQVMDLTDSRMLYALLEDNLRSTKMPGSNSNVPTTLSKARSYLEKEIEQNSAKVAEQMSSTLLASAPEMRQQLESYAIEQAVQVLDKGLQMTEQKFRGIIANNRDFIEQFINDSAENDAVAQDRLDELVAAMEHELQADLKRQADEILDTVQFANQWLDGLSEGVGLNHEQQLERQFVMILHRIQLEQKDPSLKDKEIASDADSTPRSATDEGQAKDVEEAEDKEEKASDSADKPSDSADKPSDPQEKEGS